MSPAAAPDPSADLRPTSPDPGARSAARRYFAPAKVNLGLSVLGLRADGYHELHTLMAPLALGDELEVSPAPTLSLTVHGADLPTGEGNLVYRAARLYLEAAGEPGGAAITLHKALPLASGLGGGSSDAATALMALARLYPARVDLAALALRLGADVPFFLLGRPALARGVGEQLEALDLPRVWLVLVNPGVEVSARDAYRWLDEEEAFTPPLPLDALLSALEGGVEPASGGAAGARKGPGAARSGVPYFNALQAPVAARHAPVRAALGALQDAGLHSALMSGSGSTCFALAPDEAGAHAAATALQRRWPQWWVRATQVLGR